MRFSVQVLFLQEGGTGMYRKDIGNVLQEPEVQETEGRKVPEYRKLYEKMLQASVKEPDNIHIYRDLTDLLSLWAKSGKRKDPYYAASIILNRMSAQMRNYVLQKKYSQAEEYRGAIYKLLKFSAVENFDHFMQAMEFDRDKDSKFYLPRRKVLKPIVDAMQALEDGKLNELFMSLPPRVGKTGLTTFYSVWKFGRDSEQSNLYVSYSDKLTTAFYDGVMEMLLDEFTYHWNDIFPSAKIAGKNARDLTLDIDREKKYHTFTARSLYGTLNGATDVSSGGLLVADDVLSGIEEAVNPERLDTAWNHVDNNMLTRAKPLAKILWVGTRWANEDPIGRRIELLRHDPKYKNRRYTVINIPALDEKDHSNFEYDNPEISMTTEYFLQRRASFEKSGDLASWYAQYQGEPINREGSLFDVSNMRYYNGILPDREPDRVFTAIDPAFGGGDYTAAPIVYQYDQEYYVVDVIYSNGDKSITQPLIAEKAVQHGITAMQIEATKSTQPYVDGVQECLKQADYHLTIITKTAPTTLAKEMRIKDAAPDIIMNFTFLDSGHRTKEYELFMQNVFSFKTTGRNKTDDAPDSLAMTAKMAFAPKLPRAYAFRRPV